MIHEFDPIIYPCKLWVAIRPTKSELSDRFEWMDNYKPVEVDFKDHDGMAGLVRDVNSRLVGVLIVFDCKKSCTVGTIAHESAHAADEIWKRIGETEYGCEANAYLVGWIAECIWKVKTNKIDKR